MALSKLTSKSYIRVLRDIRENCSEAESNETLPSYTVSEVRSCVYDLSDVIESSRTFTNEVLQMVTDLIAYFSSNHKYRSESQRLIRKTKSIEKEAREVAGRIHRAYTQINSRGINEKLLQALDFAESSYKYANRSYLQAQSKATEKRNGAENWEIAAIATFLIPGVNLVTIPGALISNSKAKDAEALSSSARYMLSKAQDDLSIAHRKKEEAESLKNYFVRNLKDLENVSEKVSEFWQYSSDKFGSISAHIENAQLMSECGFQEILQQEVIDDLRKIESDLCTYYSLSAQFI